MAILWKLKTARQIGGIAGLGQVGELLVKRLASARTGNGIPISGICIRGRRHCSQRVSFGIDVTTLVVKIVRSIARSHVA
jgi:hypothetical protein